MIDGAPVTEIEGCQIDVRVGCRVVVPGMDGGATCPIDVNLVRQFMIGEKKDVKKHN